MKILHVINSLDIGGAEILLKDMSMRLLQQGIKTEIMVLKSSNSSIEKELKNFGIKILTTGESSVYSPKNILKLVNFFSNNDNDIVHVHLFPAQLWVALAAQLSSKKITVITTEHSTLNRRRNLWLRPLDTWMYRQYDNVVCISEATALGLTKWLPQYKSKVSIISNGIPMENFYSSEPLIKKDIIGSDHNQVILSVGRFEAAKDQATIIRSLTNVKQAHLVLVGDGSLRSNLENLASSLGLKERVHFLGHRSDVPRLIKMADVYVQSSHWEGFGIAAVEAMVGGLPVIVSKVPGLMDVVDDAGLFFNAGNDQELSNKLNFILNNPIDRELLIEKGRVRSQQFSIEHTVDKYINLYHKLF